MTVNEFFSISNMKPVKDIFELFFPKLCMYCEEQLHANEEHICLRCRFELPLTNFSNQKGNDLEKTFHGRVHIDFATSLCMYQRKGITQHLIHQLKYKGKEELGTFFGSWLATELQASERCPQFDFIVPVPLHEKKLKARGYNQVTKFGQKISKTLEVPYNSSVLLRKLDSQTQTSKLRIERFKDLKEKFFIDTPIIFENKHILLVDDVVTTGATLEACVIKLQKIKGIKVSLATIAFTE